MASPEMGLVLAWGGLGWLLMGFTHGGCGGEESLPPAYGYRLRGLVCHGNRPSGCFTPPGKCRASGSLTLPPRGDLQVTLLGKPIATKPSLKMIVEAVGINPACCPREGVGVAAGSPQCAAREGRCRRVTPRLPENTAAERRDGLGCAHTALPSHCAVSVVESGSFPPRGVRKESWELLPGHRPLWSLHSESHSEPGGNCPETGSPET